ncbi:hypothetical protein J4E80_004347 [Alternaria sp. BMP 0032]|nr:hypothetical protein J4E80_004347 [Alternaria sp. BMP 0032]
MKFGHKKDEPAPPDPVFDEDEDLSEVWPQVVRQYEDTTKRKLDANTTFNSFQLQIDADIKDCLEQFGCMVAQVAGVVFGPAAQCWNAISIVVQAARSISGMMDGFVILMERSSAFIRRLVNFMEQKVGEGGSHLPRVLRRPAYNILSQFLGVLRCSYKLATSKKERWNKWAEIVLFNSDEMAESLKLMEDQIQEFTRAEVDGILLDVKGLAKHLVASDAERDRYRDEINTHFQTVYKVSDQILSVTQQMKTTLDGRASKEQQKENLLKIANSLGLKNPGNWETWSKRHSELCKTHVEGTGGWLSRDEPAFIQWADLDQHDKNLLFLKADSGFGKTHLFNYVISYLEKKCQVSRGPNPAFLAYYYYGDDKDDSLERCIGSIIYQFADADVGYAQAVVEQCARLASIARAEDRWNKLVWGLQCVMKGTYFICIDGFDSRGQLGTAEKMISAIAGQAPSSAKSNGVTLRLFVSGNEDALSEVSPVSKGVDLILLGKGRSSEESMRRAGNDSDIASHLLPNASDLRAVTRARIEEVCKNKPGLKAILDDSNIELLLEGIRGNYRNLEAKITEINACDTKGKVQDVISNTGADMNTVQRNRIKTLDALLNSRQARVLNGLLVWVAGCIYPPSIELLKSVLFFTIGEEFLLADQITTTYSPVLMIDEENRVRFKDGLREILSTSDSSGTESALSRLRDEKISEGEVSLCQRFIKNACATMDYDRFGFDSFFEAMAQKVHIHLDDENALNVAIIDMCVNVLLDSRKDKNLDAMREYASMWFYEYVKTLVKVLDDFEPGREFMTSIGSKLIDLLYDSNMIDTWFTNKNLVTMKYDFLYKDEFIDPLVTLLQNSQVAKGYAKDEEKSEWVKTIFNPDRPFEEWNPPSNADVEEYICWVKAHKNGDIDSSTWNYRVGATYIVFQHYKEAIVALKKAEEHSPTNWGLFFNLAKAHENQKDYRTALGYIQNFKSLSEMFLETDDTYKGAYWDMRKREGYCYRECHDYNMAVQSYRELLNQNISEASGVSLLHLHALLGLFKIWTDTKSFQSIIDLIRSWNDATAKGRGSTYWLRRASQQDVLHPYIILAAKHVGTVEEIISLYQEAIDYKALDQTTVDEPGMDMSTEATKELQYFQAVLKFHGGKLRNDQHQSIQCWEDMVLKFDEGPASYRTARKATRKLAPTLLDLAVAEVVAVSPNPSEGYLGQLEKLVNSNTTIICYLRQGHFDPGLCLARFYCVKQNHCLASKRVQTRLCSVFDKWPETINDTSFTMRFSKLAPTLNVLDKDVDAIAAWQAIAPYQLSPATGAETDATGTGELQQPFSESSNTDGVPTTSDQSSADGPAASTSIPTTTKAKLLDDDLHLLVCDKNHKMLYLPPFDWENWRTIPADMMTLDKQLVSRKEWVDKLRKEYKVQQEEIDFLKMDKARELWAAGIITVRRRNRLQRAKTFREVAGAIVTSSVMKQHHSE